MEILYFGNEGTSLLQSSCYNSGLWKNGIYTFLNNPIFGIGPTNVQNYLNLNLIENFDPYNNNEHPHNHYIQAFAETGLLGGVFYISICCSIIIDCYKATKFNYNKFEKMFSYSLFISSICLFWPFANNFDLFGQQQNAYLWYVISLVCVSTNT